MYLTNGDQEMEGQPKLNELFLAGKMDLFSNLFCRDKIRNVLFKWKLCHEA